MCEVCAKELYKERRRRQYADKRRKKGLLATKRLTPETNRAVNLALWLQDFGDSDQVARGRHIDLG